MWTWILLGVACTGAPTSAASTSRITAPPPRVVNLGAAAAGDLDGDGDIDLVTTAARPLYNDGFGQFTPGAITWTGPDGPLTWYGAVVAVADLDGDGFGDIVTSQDTYIPSDDWFNPDATGVWVPRVGFARGGPGGVTAGATLDAAGGAWSSASALVRVGDTDGDGLEEVASSVAGGWGFFDADHRYDAATSTRFEVGGLAAVGDSDGDGLDDVVMGAVRSTRGVVWQAGTTVGPAPQEGLNPYDPAYPDPAHALLADWVWWGAEPDDAMLASVSRGVIVAAPGDLDDDGLADLIVVESALGSRLSWFSGRPAIDGGGFGDAPIGTLVGSASDSLANARVVGADLDGDGIREVVASASVHGQVVLLVFEPAAGEVRPERVIDVSFQGAYSVRTMTSPGDLDGDGADDLIVDGWILFGGDVSCPGPRAWYLDNDADGFSSDAHVVWTCTPPAGATEAPGDDCDDDLAAAHPGAWEYVGGDDLACDGWVSCYQDADLDDAGGPPRLFPAYSCGRLLPVAWVDCDDADPARAPGRSDVLGNAVDEDCDGALSCFADRDGDGYGYASVRIVGPTCDDPARAASSIGGDCSDADPLHHENITTYRDRDGDGFGGPSVYLQCEVRPGYVLTSTDCDDYNAARYPGPAELIGGGDENCDGYMDCYDDDDWDGIGSSVVLSVRVSQNTSTCEGYADLASVTGDCDDNDPLAGGPIAGSPPAYRDEDGDGYGAGVGLPGCAGPGMVLAAGDCDDQDDNAYPGSVWERLGGPDLDCDGLIQCAADLDGDQRVGDTVVLLPLTSCPSNLGGDCDDTEPEAWGGHAEVPGDGIDNNCNGYLGPAVTVEPYDDRGILRLSLTAYEFPLRETLHFLVSTVGPGAGPCVRGVASCAGILSPREVASGRSRIFSTLNVATPPVPVPSGTRVWVQVLSDTAASPVVSYVIP
jgi:hypothetical protein